MAVETVLRHEPVFAYSLKQQAAIATPLASTDLTKVIRLKKTPLPDFVSETMDDRDRFSRGNEWALEQKVERHDITFDFTCDCDSHSAGFLFAFAMGHVTSATISTLAYSHIIKPKDTEDDKSLPVTTFALSLHPDGPKKKLRAMACDTVELNLALKDRIEITSTWKGSGESTATTMTFPTGMVAQSYMRAGDVQFNLGTGATLTDYSDDLETFKFAYKNGMPDDKRFRYGGGLYANEFCVGKREADLSLRLRIDKDALTELDDLRAQNEKALQLVITGPAIDSESEKITLDIPVFQYKEVKFAESGEEIVVDITATLLYDTTTGAPVAITVVNTDAAYLATG